MKRSILTLILLVIPLAACSATQSNTDDDIRSVSASNEAMTDEDIDTAVGTQLLAESSTEAGAIKTETNDGIVRLTGSVETIVQKERATEYASAVPGVRGVVNLLEIEPPTVPDDVLEERVIARLARNPATESYELNVEANEGLVVLTGTLDSYAEAELATQVTKGALGVRDIVNDADIQFDGKRTDQDMEDEVQQRLVWDSRVDASGIVVNVYEGRVALVGHTPSAFQKGIARSLSWVRGVEAVQTSGLTVYPEDGTSDRSLARLDDDSVADAVNDALEFDPRTEAAKTQVVVQDGEVTITGTVDSTTAKYAAAETASNVHGVYDVNNLLIVNNGASLPSEPVTIGY